MNDSTAAQEWSAVVRIADVSADRRQLTVSAAAIWHARDAMAAVTRERHAAVVAMKMATEEREAARAGLDRLGALLAAAHAASEALQPGIDHLRETCDALERERDEARALNAAWEEKAATWMASPEAAQRLQGYRDLGQQVAQAQNERDALRLQVERLHDEVESLLTADEAALRAENEKLRLVAIAMGRELMRVNEIMLSECGNGLVNLHLLDPIRKHLG